MLPFHPGCADLNFVRDEVTLPATAFNHEGLGDSSLESSAAYQAGGSPGVRVKEVPVVPALGKLRQEQQASLAQLVRPGSGANPDKKERLGG